MMMESAPIPANTITTGLPTGPLDKLSYKELQVLAMSLNLPGKMKQGVLVEAIRARQNQNENAVAMILEANRQRKLMRRQEQHQLQQQQLMRLNAERGAYLVANNGGSSRRKPAFPRPRMKRSASEMETENHLLNEENLKRSKLAAALTQLRRPPYLNQATGIGQRREHASGGTWEPACLEQMPQQQQHHQQLLTIRPLPDLSKELSVLPLNECNTTATPPSSDEPCNASMCSASSWNSMSTNAETLPTVNNENFDSSCDSGWMGSPNETESYDANSTWRSNPKQTANNQSYDSNQTNMSNQSTATGYYDHAQPSAYNNNCSNSNAEYRSADFPATTNATSGNVNYSDCPPHCQTQGCQRSNWISAPTQNQQPVPLHIAVMTSRLWFDCYDANCYHKNSPLFRVQRPGNPSPLFVSSGRGFTLPTFCNMFSRVSSYVHNLPNARAPL